jgi:PAS domain-containing protein
MNLTEIPKGYITITSGLGDTPPENLLLIPVLHENELLGVFEIASLKRFKQHEIEFSQEVAYSLGATLVNTRNNQKTAELLSKSQRQGIEMAEQEEEMRQNMEELKATQEESGRREEELKGVIDALGNALMIISYDTDGFVLDVNDRFCHFIGRDRNDIIGKSHLEIFNGTFTADRDFWLKVEETGVQIIRETIRIGKKSYNIHEHFASVHNRSNITVKYINFVTDGRTGNS